MEEYEYLISAGETLQCNRWISHLSIANEQMWIAKMKKKMCVTSVTTLLAHKAPAERNSSDLAVLAVNPLWLHCRSAVAPLSLRCQSAVALMSIHCRSAINPLSLRYQSVITPLSLRCRDALAW